MHTKKAVVITILPFPSTDVHTIFQHLQELKKGQYDIQYKLSALQQRVQQATPTPTPTPAVQHASVFSPLQLDLSTSTCISDPDVAECLSILSGDDVSLPSGYPHQQVSMVAPSGSLPYHSQPSTSHYFPIPKTPPRVNVEQVAFPGTPQERKIERILKQPVYQDVNNVGRLAIALARQVFFGDEVITRDDWI